MLDKPTTLPKFAELDQIDPTSGENNVVAPIPTKQNYGWTFKEKPPRQHFNWLHRWTYRWLKWTDDYFQEGTIPMLMTCGGPVTFNGYSALGVGSAGELVGTEIYFDMEYRIFGDIIEIIIPYGDTDNPNGRGVYGIAIDAPPAFLKIEPRTSWPISFNTASRQICSAVLVDQSEPRAAFLTVSKLTELAISTITYVTSFFPIVGGGVGLTGQIIRFFKYS